MPAQKLTEERKPIVVVDSREASSAPKLTEYLRILGAEVVIEPLDKGDYVISDNCAIERKEVRDYVGTLTRRDLFEQLFGLKELCSIPIVLIEGYMRLIYKFSRISPSSIWASIFALMKNGIYVANTLNYKESAEFIYTIAKHEQILKPKRPTIRKLKKLAEELSDKQVYLVAGLPHINRTMSERLLTHFKTPLKIFSAEKDELVRVKGIGDKIASEIIEVLRAEYSPKKEKGNF